MFISHRVFFVIVEGLLVLVVDGFLVLVQLFTHVKSPRIGIFLGRGIGRTQRRSENPSAR